MTQAVIFVNAHGSSDTTKRIFNGPNEWAAHSVGIGTATARENVTSKDLADTAKWIRSLGIGVVVIDHSCDGGSTVKLFEADFDKDIPVCAIATTGTVTPSSVVFPEFDTPIANTVYRNYEQLGKWASQQVIPTIRSNYRVQHYGYMNGCSGSMTLREALNYASTNMTTYPYWNRLRNSHVYLNPERYYDGNQTNQGADNYGPLPNVLLAKSLFEQYSERDIDNVKGANTVFAWAYSVPEYAAIRPYVNSIYDTIRTDLANQFDRWKVAFNSADEAVRKHRLCGVELAERVRDWFWKYPSCGRVIVTPAGCPTAERERYIRYHNLACNYPEKLVPEILRDYPEVGGPIQLLQEIEKATFQKIVSISDELYNNVEQRICDAKACRTLRLGN